MMDECIGYLIAGVLILYAAIMFIVYVVIPFVAIALGITVAIAVLYGLYNTVRNYIEALVEVFGGTP